MNPNTFRDSPLLWYMNVATDKDLHTGLHTLHMVCKDIPWGAVRKYFNAYSFFYSFESFILVYDHNVHNIL